MRRVQLGLGVPAGEWPAVSVTVGNFDGVHRGHQALITAAVTSARETAGTAVVLTFEPHPSQILNPEAAPLALTTARQKEELLAALGADVMAVLPFTPAVARLTPAEFAEGVLAAGLHARRVLVGAAFRFGHRQAGDIEVLRALGRERGFSVEPVSPVAAAGQPISSSRVREALARGDTALARALLGRPYFVDGRVVPGDGRGRTLGLPTANLSPENAILPAPGVYAGRVRPLGGAWHRAVVNVGRRPTFGGVDLRVEAHILDFEADLYGSQLRLLFEDRLRAEAHFTNVAELVARIRQDIAEARALLSGPRGEGV